MVLTVRGRTLVRDSRRPLDDCATGLGAPGVIEARRIKVRSTDARVNEDMFDGIGRAEKRFETSIP